MTCRDCIHYDVCSHCYIYEVVEGYDACECEYFKDKALEKAWQERNPNNNPETLSPNRDELIA